MKTKRPRPLDDGAIMGMGILANLVKYVHKPKKLMNKLKPIILRKSQPSKEELDKLPRNPVYLILDEVQDTYNIGSLYRLADAIGVTKMYLCGDMEYPPSSRVHRAAVGTENWVAWEKRETTMEVVDELKQKGVQILAVEQDGRSINYKDLGNHLRFPVAIVVGNETRGIGKEILKKADIIVEFPMYGVNNSFNVWGSAAILSYKVLESL
jgi:23S rRNA (guanosine2251-2'-O)-methyltransferase